MCSNRYCGKIKGKYPRITTLALLIVECHGSQWYVMTHYIVPEDIITHYTVPEDTEVFNSMWTGNFQMFNLDLEKAEEPEIKLPTSIGSSKKQERSIKNIYFCFIDYVKAFDCVGHNNLWKILKEIGIPEHLTCLLRNLYAGQEATVRTGHGTTDWFQIRKEVCECWIVSPCLFNLYAEYIMRNSGLDETQAGIKIARRNINNLRYADDTALKAESEEELEPLDESERGEWKSWL